MMSGAPASISTSTLTALLLAAACGCGTSNASPPPPATEAPASEPPSASASVSATPTTAPAAPPVTACLDIERHDPVTGTCAPGCPQGEVYVPPTGPEGFVMGQSIRLPKDRPHKVVLTQPFCIDANEITAGEYEQCAKEQGCTVPRNIGPWGTFEKKPDHPVNKIHWKQALYYCEKQGKTLPTEAQWEWAATGGDGRKWPWGDEQPTCEHADFTIGTMPTPAANAGCHGGGTSPVGSHPKGDRVWPAGKIHDLAGNVWEWCFDNYVAYPTEDQTDPVHMTNVEATHVVRGGGWNRSVVGIRTAYRGGAVVDYQRPGLGARCARNATRPTPAK
jgi:formylglycine-generating enzyme required for sulfatase activity